MSAATSILERDALGAFCTHTHVTRPATADGALYGLSFGLKDIYDVAGHHTGFGSPDWLRTHAAALADASVLTRLLAAGASLAGKTHTEEMAFSLTGENAHYGTPINPAAPGRVPGGSSSGSAAAVAGGLVDFAIGSDTGGSVRAPASFCGVYGIRPTHGRIALDGVLPLAPMFDTCGWFARDAPLLSRIGDVLLSGATPAPAGQLLYADDAFAHAFPDVAAALTPAVHRVESLLGAATHVMLSEDGLSSWFEVFRTLQHDAIWRAHGEWVMRTKPTFGPQIRARFAAVATTDANALTRAQHKHAQIRARLDHLLRNNAVLLMPTMPDIAPLRNEASVTAVPMRERALALLCVAGLGGLPQVTMPVATVRGCPIALSLLAAPGSDELLLQIARDFA